MSLKSWNARERLWQDLGALIAAQGYRANANRLNLAGITDMGGLFSCEVLTSKKSINLRRFCGDISDWDTSKVTDMSSMFRGSSFVGDISRWNVEHVEDMSSMFMEASCRVDISSWNTASLCRATSMFLNCKMKHADLSTWKTDKLYAATNMFMNSACNPGDLSAWNMPRLSLANSMFQGVKFNLDVSAWRPVSLYDANRMFCFSTFDGDLSQWSIPRLHRAQAMFACTPYSKNGLLDSSRALHLHEDAPGALLIDIVEGDVAAREWLRTTRHKGRAAFDLAEDTAFADWLSAEEQEHCRTARLLLATMAPACLDVGSKVWEYWKRRQDEVLDMNPELSAILETVVK